MADRPPVPVSVITSILTQSARRCALCFGLRGDVSEKKGQLAHLDRNPSNSDEGNLAYLCLDHHDQYDSRTSQSKGLTEGEVKEYRARLYRALGAATVRAPGIPERSANDASPRLSAAWARLGDIDRGSLRFGITLGWQLARFEFIDGTSVADTRAATAEIRRDLTNLLTQDGCLCSTQGKDAREIIREVITTYSNTSPSKHTAILLGIAAMRNTLVGASKNADHNAEIRTLSYAALLDIDPLFMKDKEAFFSYLVVAKPMNITGLLEFIDTLASGSAVEG